jgi:hypothetical protein
MGRVAIGVRFDITAFAVIAIIRSARDVRSKAGQLQSTGRT